MIGKYEVRTWTMCDGWVNAWSVGNDDDEMKPQTFATIAEAEKEIQEHIDDCNDGRRREGLEEDETGEDLRIVEISTGDFVG